MNKQDIGEFMKLYRLKATKKKNTIWGLIKENKWILLVTVAYFIISTAWLLSLHYNFLTSGDLGQYTQMFWNTIQGNGILETYSRVRPGNVDGFYFWEHFSPILLLFVPIFYLSPNPETLLILKTFFVSVSIPMLWFVAKQKLNSKLAFIVVISYILNPFLLRAVSFNFQEQFILPFIIFFAFYFFFKENYKFFIILTLIGLSVNEYSASIAMLALLGVSFTEHQKLKYTGIIKTIKNKTVYLPLILSIISLLYFISVMYIMQSNAEVGVVTSDATKRESAIGYVISTFSNPSNIIDILFKDVRDRILYLNLFLIPTFYIALLSPITTLPLVLYVGFGWIINNASLYEFDAHHAFYMLPYLYIGYIYGIQKFISDWNLISDYSKKLILKLAVVVSILLFIIQIASFIGADYYPPYDTHTKTLNNVINLIPKNSSILAQDNIQPHLANRNKTYIGVDDRYYPLLEVNGFIDFKYIIIDTNKRKYNLMWYDRIKPILESIEKSEVDHYGVWVYADGIFVLKRDYYGQITIIKNKGAPKYKVVYNSTNLNLWGGFKDSEGIFVHPYNYTGKTFWFAPYVFQPPGNYTITFEIKRGDYIGNDKRLITLDITKDKAEHTIKTKDVNYSDVGTEWTNISLIVQINSISNDMEFRGMEPSPDVDIYLKQITVEEIVGDE